MYGGSGRVKDRVVCRGRFYNAVFMLMEDWCCVVQRNTIVNKVKKG